MKPIRGIFPFALWLIRLFVLFFVSATFFDTLMIFSFQGFYYFVTLIFVIASWLLFAGGFFKKSTTTVFSGLLIFLLSGYILFDVFEGFKVQFITIYSPWIFCGAAGLLFASLGNKS